MNEPKKKFKIVEDSVDSLIVNKKALFPNKGEFEIFSIPKIIGTKGKVNNGVNMIVFSIILLIDTLHVDEKA